MADRMTLCQRYEHDEAAGQYRAVAQVDTLPKELSGDDHVVHHGYAVEIGPGLTFFFAAIEPALAFGRAARMSLECRAYSVRKAAREYRYCDRHGEDEAVLLVAGDTLDRKDDEVELLKRFVQSVKEHRKSAHWHEPTGYLTEYHNGKPATTRHRSLPL